MKKLAIVILVWLSIEGFSQTAPLSTFSKAEAKEALGFLSVQKTVTANSKFIFASGDMKGYIKVNGKVISLKHDGGTNSDTTGSSIFVNDQYSVLSSSRVLKMAKDKYDPKTIWERTIEIKDLKTEKILFSGKVYPLESPAIPEKYNLLDKEVIDQVLVDIIGGLKNIPQEKGKYDGENSTSSKLSALKESRSASSILTDRKTYLTFSSYEFNSTPAKSAKLLKEFLELKKEIAPFSEKEKTITSGKETVTSFIYWRSLMFAELELKVEKLSSTMTQNIFSIEYYPNIEENGRTMLVTRILDSVLANAGTISRIMKQEEDVTDEGHFFSINPRYGANFSPVVRKPSPYVLVNKSKYYYTVHLIMTSPYTIPKFLFEVKNYMADKYKSTGLFKTGKSFDLPNELVFTKFDKNNPGLELKVRYFEDGKEVLFNLMISNTISKEEATKIAALPVASQTATVQKETEKKPPLLKMFRDKNGLYGFQDINNGLAVIVPAEYKFVGKVSEGLIAVTKDGDKWGYIDETGKQVIAYRFVSAKEFVNGKALVEEGDLLNSVKFYIDKTGARLK